jgi:argininosuccinate synthase
MTKHVALAYSGGLDTSYLVHWIAKTYNAKVTAILVDVGQDMSELQAAKARALANGAEDCLIVDMKDIFVHDVLTAAIQANALYQGAYPLATALARPVIAQALVEAAKSIGADAVAHGCTGKGNDQVRIEASVRALAPGMTCIAPQRSHPFTRDVVTAYAAEHGIQLPPVKTYPYSVDENLWGRSAEGNDLENPAEPVPEAAHAWTTSPFDAPAAPQTFTIDFEGGIPVALDGVKLPLATIIGSLNQQAGAHGIGRIDHVEDRLVGIKSRELYEAPAAITILAAKKALENLTLTKEEQRLKPAMEQRYGELVYDGQWYHPVRKAIQAFIETIQHNVTGTVQVQAYKGNLTVLGRTSPQSLYNEGLATYETGDSFHHLAADGFIELWSLPTEVANTVRQNFAKSSSRNVPNHLVSQ